MKGFLLCLFRAKDGKLNKKSTKYAPRSQGGRKGFILAYSVVFMLFIMTMIALMMGFINAQIDITMNAISDLDMGIIMEDIGERFVAGESFVVPEGYTHTISADGLTLTVQSSKGVILRIIVDEFGNILRWTYN